MATSLSQHMTQLTGPWRLPAQLPANGFLCC